MDPLINTLGTALSHCRDCRKNSILIVRCKFKIRCSRPRYPCFLSCQFKQNLFIHSFSTCRCVAMIDLLASLDKCLPHLLSLMCKRQRISSYIEFRLEDLEPTLRFEVIKTLYKGRNDHAFLICNEKKTKRN